MRRLTLLLALIGGGCSTTTFDFAHPDESRRWIQDHAGYGQRVAYAADPGAIAEQPGTLIDATSPTEIRFKTAGGQIVPLQNVKRVVAVEHGWGALEGALIGAGSGLLFGALHGATAPLGAFERSMDCTLVCSSSDEAKLEALGFGTLGLLLGAGIGALIGHHAILEWK